MKRAQGRRGEMRGILIETDIGVCGLAWSPAGLVSLMLPGADPREVAGDLARAAAITSLQDAPQWINRAVTAIRTLLSTGKTDFTGIPLDLAGVPPFHRKVYQRLKKVPPGTVITYSQLARQCGNPRAARAVGQAMAKNPLPLVIPCHRVISSGKSPGGFSAYGGVFTKLSLLSREGVKL
ncbi:MAG: methylated-DNA--[protein]-cysteine S-methyltransferase [Candidatus Eremiobacteraeota bacterium]|nr:methylated-DNA--[protein]-cysteine S-methyltransferase [Candidatus Eremiobacteraeota bacterium]